MLNMESVNFHRHCDCMGQMHIPSNRCRNGAATVNKCHGQEQKWHSLNVKHFHHLHQQNALAWQICIHEEASTVVQHIIQQCVRHCPWVSWLSQSVQQIGARELSDQQKLGRIATTLTILQRCKPEDSNFLSSIITGEETWLHHYSLWMKMQTIVWNHFTYSENNKFKATLGIWKVTATISWNICRFILIYFMPCGLMVTAFTYQLILQ